MTNILFLHIGWAREYQGDVNDPPIGKFGYIRDGHEDAGEALNFKPYKRRLYGYAPAHNLDLTRLGAGSDAAFFDGVLVIWTATEPTGGGRYVIGWYGNARVHSSLVKSRPDKTRPEIIVEADVSNCHLVPVDERAFWIPRMLKGWPGINSAFYASEFLTDEQLKRIQNYVAGERSTGFYSDFNDHGKSGGFHTKRGNGHGRSSTDAAKNALVEQAAVEAVVKHYKGLGWSWRSVEDTNCGWDLEVIQGGRQLLVEVKGRDAEGSVEVTPNEYSAMRGRDTKLNYRLAVVWNARSPNPRLRIFQYEPAAQTWVAQNGMLLKIKEKTGAIISLEVP